MANKPANVLIAKRFGADLSLALRAKGYSQTDFSKIIDTCPGRISDYVRGKRLPSPEKMKLICEVLDINYDPSINLNKLNLKLEKENLEEPDNSNFSRKLRYQLDINNICMSSLAKRIGVSRQCIKNYVDGCGLPLLDKVIKIAKVLNVPTEYFLTDDIKKRYHVKNIANINDIENIAVKKNYKIDLNDIKNIIDKHFETSEAIKILYALLALKNSEIQRARIKEDIGVL